MPEPKPEAEEKRHGKLDKAVDALRARYGKDAVVRGRLFEAHGESDRTQAAVQAERAEAHALKK